MVIKLLIVILAMLVLRTDAKNPVKRIALDKWDLYGNDLLTLVYKRLDNFYDVSPMPPASARCKYDPSSSEFCYRPSGWTPRPTELYPGKRSRDKLDLMTLFKTLSRRETPESETVESDDYDNKPEQRSN